MTRPRLAAFSMAVIFSCHWLLCYISLPTVKNKKYRKHSGLCRAVDQENPLYSLQHEGNTGCIDLRNPERRRWVGWCGGGVWRFQPGRLRGQGWRTGGRKEILHTRKWKVFKQNLDLHPRLLEVNSI